MWGGMALRAFWKGVGMIEMFILVSVKGVTLCYQRYFEAL